MSLDYLDVYFVALGFLTLTGFVVALRAIRRDEARRRGSSAKE